MDQACSLRFCILQAIKNWMAGRPGSEAKSTDITEDDILQACTALNPRIIESLVQTYQNDPMLCEPFDPDVMLQQLDRKGNSFLVNMICKTIRVL